MFENQPHDLAWEYDFFVSDVTPKHLTSAKQSCVPLFEWKSSCQPQGSCSSIRVETILSASRLIFLYSSGDNHVSLRAHVPLIRVKTANARAHRDIPWNSGWNLLATVSGPLVRGRGKSDTSVRYINCPWTSSNCT